jgi:glucokinase
MIVLAGDVGGTSTRLGLFSIENRNVKKLVFEKYPNRKFENLSEIIKLFLKTTDAHPRAAAVGIAGPVFDGICKATNLPWKIDVGPLSYAIGIGRTTIVNDFVAHAHGLDALHSKDIAVIQRGSYEGMENKALFGPGTGLGEAIVARHGGDSIVVPSEGGHQDFAPQDKIQVELLEYLMAKFGHVSNERILSGPGLMNVYEFMKKMNYAKESPAIRKLMAAKGADKPAIIMHNANKDKLCKKASDLFFSVLGAEAGNLALQAMAFGGLYIVGGLVRSNIAVMKKSPFLKSFHNKGRMSHLMKKIPVYVVKSEQLGIVGAAALASDLF